MTLGKKIERVNKRFGSHERIPSKLLEPINKINKAKGTSSKGSL